MRVRDAIEEDGELLGELADAPAEVMRNVVHDRTVRVAEREDEGDASESESDESTSDENESDAGESEGDADENEADADEPEIAGFVGFDAMPGTVRVTYLRGSQEARERLLDEPVRFAQKEGMSVEVLVPEGEETTKDVVEAAGFRQVGTGPQFEGGRTYEYRLDPT